MATYTATQSVNKTLSGSTVDTVEITGEWTVLEVVNRSLTDTLWVTSGGPGDAPDTPTVAGDNVQPVMPGERIVIRMVVPSTSKKVVKLIGSSNPYSVIGTSFRV